MLETKHQKKALVESLAVMAVIIALMFVVGLKYMDPPPPGNIAVNFGFTDEGSGPRSPSAKELTSRPPAPAPSEPAPSEPAPAEPVLTSEEPEAPAVEAAPQKKKKKPKETPQPEKKPAKPAPKPSKEASEVLDNILNAPEGNSSSASEGDDSRASGDKGNPEGDRRAPHYYGSGGTGGGDPNYRLGNRRALVKPKPRYECNEEGKVTVRVTVNPEGRVIHARVVPSGTTAGSCLTRAALEAAKATVWEKDPDAEPKQIGTIVYYFKLKE
ncbi:MAG: energy transducer TonB [Chlorobi bacterium]|nr:energy transducer TonB [Chlorobiota bacterium]